MASSNSHINSVMSQLFSLPEIDGENVSSNNCSDEDEVGRRNNDYCNTQDHSRKLDNICTNADGLADKYFDNFNFYSESSDYNGGGSSNFNYYDYPESTTTNSAQSSRRSSEYTPPNSRRGSGTSVGSSPSSAATIHKSFHDFVPSTSVGGYGERSSGECGGNNHNIDANRSYTMFNFEAQQPLNSRHQQYHKSVSSASGRFPEYFQAPINNSKSIGASLTVDTSYPTATRQPYLQQYQAVRGAQQTQAFPPPTIRGNSDSEESDTQVVATNSPIEEKVCSHCQDILSEASTNSLKAVELANTLRARVGTEILANVRVMCGGLLNVLEKYPDIFYVQRISKNDQVSLLSSAVRSPSDKSKKIVNVDKNDEGAMKNDNGDNRQFQNHDSQQQQNTFYSRFLYVENIQAHITDEEIHSNFESFGEIDTLAITVNQRLKAVNVAYRSLQDAIKAVSACNKQGFIARCVDPNNYMQPRPQQSLHPNNKRSDNNGSFHMRISSQQQGQGFPISQHTDTVLERLCDETYVPTQSWAANESSDYRYCRTISGLIQHSAGCMTISKLRGLLRQRLNARGNIKSVPLKALLNAYPRYFSLNGNLVSLSRSPNKNSKNAVDFTSYNGPRGPN